MQPLYWIQWLRECTKTEERYKIESWSTPKFRSWEEEKNPAEDSKKCQSIRQERMIVRKSSVESSKEQVISCVKCCRTVKRDKVWDLNAELSKVKNFTLLWFTSYRTHSAWLFGVLLLFPFDKSIFYAIVLASLSTTLSDCAVKRPPYVSGGGLNLKELKQGHTSLRKGQFPSRNWYFLFSHFHITKTPQASQRFY